MYLSERNQYLAQKFTVQVKYSDALPSFSVMYFTGKKSLKFL